MQRGKIHLGMIRDNIQGKSFKKNYGYLLRCDLKNFLYCVHKSCMFKYSFSINKKELLQVLQNRIKILT
jgi:hypothetical protein